MAAGSGKRGDYRDWNGRSWMFLCVCVGWCGCPDLNHRSFDLCVWVTSCERPNLNPGRVGHAKGLLRCSSSSLSDLDVFVGCACGLKGVVHSLEVFAEHRDISLDSFRRFLVNDHTLDEFGYLGHL